MEEFLAADPPPPEDELDEAFWQACHGGQLRTAQRLLTSGANIDARPGYSEQQTPLNIAESIDERRSRLRQLAA